MEGAKAYVLNDAGAWRKASVVAALGSGRYRVELDSWEGGDQTGENAAGEIVEFDASKMEGGSLPFQNANMPEAGFANMTTLDHLHEAALLHNLRVRFFSANCPYTYTADIVIAMNPYRWFPELFTEERRKEYTTFDRAKMPPHAYAASSTAYSNLRESKRDQSILVSGESGAGKTETVKILMAHLAFIASSQDSMHIKRIVESNPLLESFGNAQTVRNDNSSRFGKFIELQLNGSCTLVGSKCRTYLLEKSRVISQDKGERNYHIFYQMLASDLRDTIGLGGDKTRDNMRYTRLGQSKTDKIEGETDGEKFKTTVDALALVGVDGELLTRLLKALAGVLLLGQIDFDGGSGADDAAAVSPGTSGQAAEVATILEVDAENLAKALTSRTIKMRNESVVKRLNVPAAVAARDALAKELYSRMFDWLVGKICSATTAARSESQFFVGLLDIFGFESFAINRFEQLCINYANEKLQQKFTLDVFKAVQQEYADEGIPWDRIEFKDNAPVLALIESKLGIISMLNEECVRPKGSDENFVAKLGTAHAADANFSQPKLGAQKELQFSIRHYAGSVMYTASGWLERNKDAVSGDVTALLRSSANSLISDVFSEQEGSEEGAAEGAGPKAKMGSDTVVTKFKTSLADLMWTVGQTSTQYVRCIKPNKNKSPVEMDNMMVVEQLRCAGVIEAIRISRAGFPARMPLKELVGRFAVLVRAVAGVGFQKGAAAVQSGRPNERELAAKVLAEMGRNAELLTQCRSLVAALIPNAEQDSEIGRTRVYFKAGVLEALEERRALLQQAAVTEIARRVRGQRCHRLFEQMRASVLLLQSVQRMRRERAAFLVQRRAVTILQAHRRGVLARRRTAELRRERAATRLQACQRRRAAVRGLARARVAAVRLQAQARSRSCRRQYLVDLKEFKEQAKLENQVKALQARLQEAERAAKEAAEKAAREPSAPDGVVERVVHVQAEGDEALAADNARLRAENERLRAELERHRAEPGGTSASLEMLEALNALTAENARLKKEGEKQRAEVAHMRQEVQHLRASEATMRETLTSVKQSHQRGKASVEPSFIRAASFADHAAGSHAAAGLEPREAGPKRPPHPRAMGVEEEPDAASAKRKSRDARDPGGLRIFSPLSQFWQDVPHEMVPLLKDRSEVHIKLGHSILFVDDSGHLMWTPWMNRGRGYRQSMAFMIERRAASGSTDDDDGSVGATFAVRSSKTGRYVSTSGGLLDSHCMQVKGSAASGCVFTFVPVFTDGSMPALEGDAASRSTGSAEEFAGALKLFKDGKVLRLRNDGYVTTVSASELDGDTSKMAKMAFSIEYLLPRDSYNIEVEEDHLGITVSKDLPLRVMSLRDIVKPDQSGSLRNQSGLAEKTGRIHVGDMISGVNGQNVSGVPAQDVMAMLACKRPITITFTLPRDEGRPDALSPTSMAIAASQSEPAHVRHGMRLFAFGKRAKETASRAVETLAQKGAGTVPL